jgi:hypothetical protein
VTDTPPLPAELELSVFGPGIGECVLAHVGDGAWIVVDSCIDRRSGNPIALDYLHSIGVDIASQVELVIATHWHDDHIQGLSDIFRAAEKARFVNSAAYSFRDLLRVVKLGSAGAPLSSATREYAEIVKILEQRRTKGERREAVGPIQAFANRKLLSLTGSHRSVTAEVFALSPADGVFNRAHEELQAALSFVEQRRRPTAQGENQLCIVVWLAVGALNVLLGADLEYVTAKTEGWNAIVGSTERPFGRALVVKVPHHGSEGADCPDSWKHLLVDEPFAVLTPYTPSNLPRPKDINRLCGQTPNVFLTSDPTHYRLPRRENAVEKTLRGIALKRRALEGQMGHVRFRCDARVIGETRYDLINGAKKECGPVTLQ